MVGFAALAVATAACEPQSLTSTTPTPTPSEPEDLEPVLEAAYTRTGLRHLEREEMILQPLASIPTLTFNLGSACSGQIEMPDSTKYGIKVYTRDLSVTIIDVTLPVGHPGKLSDPDIAKVARECSA